ncbi:unnamed protein product [Caenorhabditis bovis]|uniref:Uncharacterized protein n=1 Tax=Caenorhabditis bovis TaxID=2654633 RepID=A0A8S1ETZ3_9PELO|nr:unnamed protein product [Caenorhabditis bovis]
MYLYFIQKQPTTCLCLPAKCFMDTLQAMIFILLAVLLFNNSEMPIPILFAVQCIVTLGYIYEIAPIIGIHILIQFIGLFCHVFTTAIAFVILFRPDLQNDIQKYAILSPIYFKEGLAFSGWYWLALFVLFIVISYLIELSMSVLTYVMSKKAYARAAAEFADTTQGIYHYNADAYDGRSTDRLYPELIMLAILLVDIVKLMVFTAKCHGLILVYIVSMLAANGFFGFAHYKEAYALIFVHVMTLIGFIIAHTVAIFVLELNMKCKILENLIELKNLFSVPRRSEMFAIARSARN